MNEWFSSPLLWVVFLSLLPVAAGAIFAFGQWKGRVDSDRVLFKGLMAEVRNDTKEMLRRLPSPTVAANSPIRLADLGKSNSERFTAL